LSGSWANAASTYLRAWHDPFDSPLFSTPIGSFGTSFALSDSGSLLDASNFTGPIGSYGTKYAFADPEYALVSEGRFTGSVGAYGQKFSLVEPSSDILDPVLFT
jgi:hypothetical protein